MTSNGIKIYLASPLFSTAERSRNAHLRDLISSFANVYLPQEDGGLIFDLVSSGMSPVEAKHRIFREDISAIARCDVLVIVMDGRTIDEGAAFELGYAFALGKACVGLKTDARSLFTFGDNPMIEGAVREIFHDETSLCRWLEEYNLAH